LLLFAFAFAFAFAYAYHLSFERQVRGEAYDKVKSTKKKTISKKQEKQQTRKRASKAVMYEADDLGDTNAAAVHVGLGNSDAKGRVKKHRNTMNMPLAQRSQMKDSDNGAVQIKHKGGAKEVTYIPLAARKKMEEKKSREAENEGSEGRIKRQRRGVKELGFKAPFKKH
jgi:hypothetical protein